MQRKYINKKNPMPAQQSTQFQFQPRFIPKKAQRVTVISSTNAILRSLDKLSEEVSDLSLVDSTSLNEALLCLAHAARVSFPNCSRLQLTLMCFLFLAWSTANAADNCKTSDITIPVDLTYGNCTTLKVINEYTFLNPRGSTWGGEVSKTKVCSFLIDCVNSLTGELQHFMVNKFPATYFQVLPVKWSYDGDKLIESWPAGGTIAAETPLPIDYANYYLPMGDTCEVAELASDSASFKLR